MAVFANDDTMNSDLSPHTGRRVPGQAGPEEWTVSWLPGHLLDRISAATAMQIADTVGGVAITDDGKDWPSVQAWARELGIDPGDAVVQILREAPPDRPVEQNLQPQRGPRISPEPDSWRGEGWAGPGASQDAMANGADMLGDHDAEAGQ